jgi:hypothetical protein
VFGNRNRKAGMSGLFHCDMAGQHSRQRAMRRPGYFPVASRPSKTIPALNE